MRTIISGPVTPAHLADAELFGIEASTLVTNGAPLPRVELGLPATCYPIDPKLGELGQVARDYTLCLNADALIYVGENPHLVKVAQSLGLPCYGTP